MSRKNKKIYDGVSHLSLSRREKRHNKRLASKRMRKISAGGDE